MLFNSYVFILVFLPITLFGYYQLNKRSNTSGNLFLLCASLFFYGFYNWSYLIVICVSIIFNYFFSRRLSGHRNKILLAFGLLLNVGVIFYFKYYGFFLENINFLFGKSFLVQEIVLPLGISFFTFQQISYLLDSYKGSTKAYSFLEYALFVAFFPQLIAGPIVLHNEIIPQFRDPSKRIFNADHVGEGIQIFAIGLVKKVLLADTFGKAVAWKTGIDELFPAEALVIALSYTFQIYFDFSGYCDMAIGVGKMFNIQLPVNFNSPYKAVSIVDFWKRWHLTLTRFLRNYLYIPLGGNRKGQMRTYLNIMLVFLVSGLWHGANWTFILWGALHGIAYCIEYFMKKKSAGSNRVPKFVRWLLTFGFLILTWIIFASDTVGEAAIWIKSIFSPGWFESGRLLIRNGLRNCFVLPEVSKGIRIIPGVEALINRIPGFFMWGFFAVAMFIVLKCKNCSERVCEFNLKIGVITTVLLVWGIVSLSGMSVFLYFGF